MGKQFVKDVLRGEQLHLRVPTALQNVVVNIILNFKNLLKLHETNGKKQHHGKAEGKSRICQVVNTTPLS